MNKLGIVVRFGGARLHSLVNLLLDHTVHTRTPAHRHTPIRYIVFLSFRNCVFSVSYSFPYYHSLLCCSKSQQISSKQHFSISFISINLISFSHIWIVVFKSPRASFSEWQRDSDRKNSLCVNQSIGHAFNKFNLNLWQIWWIISKVCEKIKRKLTIWTDYSFEQYQKKETQKIKLRKKYVERVHHRVNRIRWRSKEYKQVECTYHGKRIRKENY